MKQKTIWIPPTTTQNIFASIDVANGLDSSLISVFSTRTAMTMREEYDVIKERYKKIKSLKNKLKKIKNF